MIEIDNFFKERYNYLYEATKNLSNKFDKNINGEEVISELYIWLNENKEKVIPYIKINKLEGFCITWISTQIRYPNSPFRLKNMLITNDDEITIPEIETSDDDIENKQSKEKLLIKIDVQLSMLSKPEKILYDYYYVKGYSLRKIASLCQVKINHSSIYQMLKEMENKIKMNINEQR